jgi:hypothetical protein
MNKVASMNKEERERFIKQCVAMLNSGYTWAQTERRHKTTRKTISAEAAALGLVVKSKFLETTKTKTKTKN